jgi:FtsH-binding integral membrane protein
MGVNWLIGLPSYLTYAPVGMAVAMIVGCWLGNYSRAIIFSWVLISIAQFLIAFDISYATLWKFFN